MRVKKRDGKIEELDLNKIHKVLTWACEGNDEIPPIKGVSVSQIELNANLHLHDKIGTKDIHETLIKAASDLISEDTPNYDQVAARLVWFAVRKEAFASNHPPHLLTVINKNIENGYYSPQILEFYDSEEINEINNMIDHKRDDLFRYAGAVQMRSKYLVQNRRTKLVTESFQFPYIMVAATLFASYPKHTRLEFVKDYYDAISRHNLNEPTPVMAGVRTKRKQYSSCTLISAGDSIDSIKGAGSAIIDYATNMAGIGLDIGRIRGAGQEIRGGEAISTGVIPFAKKFNGDLKSCSQGSIRGASATFNYPWWHIEYESLIELKNEKGSAETRLRTVDYCVHFNRLVFKRWAAKQELTLFSPEEVPELWSAFYSADNDEFERIYEKLESTKGLTIRKIPAQKLVEKFLLERFETGRIYAFFADTVNRQTSFLEPITLTNLCCEVTLPTTPPLESDRSVGRVALCTLGAISVGKLGDLDNPKEQARIARLCELAVRAKDALLDYQEYPIPEAEASTKEYRPLGIGIIGFAHFLAKNRLMWGTEEAKEKTNQLMELISYHLISASVTLASEKGACKETKYHHGWMPFDDSPIKMKKRLDWDSLRNKARIYGIRNATLMACMPSETSSQLSNETNGFEPPKELVTVKGSRDGSLNQLVPEYAKLNPYYETVFEVKVKDYLNTVAVIQQYVDQAMSTNTSYDPAKYPAGPNGEFSVSQLASDFALAYKLGLKTLYYNNTNDSKTIVEDDCASGACKI